MKLFVIVCVATQLFAANSRILPDLSLPCRKSDPNIKSCFLKAADKLISYVRTGIPEYYIPSGDPLKVPIFRFNGAMTDLATVNAVFKNVKVFGLSHVTIDDFKMDLENYAGELKTTHPHIYVTCEYKITGRMLNAPFRSEGYLSGNITDCQNLFTASFKSYKKEGVKYFALKNFELNNKIGHGHLEITAKNPEDQSMVDLYVNTFNEHDRQILDIANPVYTEAAEYVLRSLITEVLSFVPAELVLIE